MAFDARRAKWWIRDRLQSVMPRVTFAMLANRSWLHEPELAIVPLLSPTRLTAVDAGANKGVYTYHLGRYFGRVIAFEPQPALASFLRRAAPRNVEVREAGLSAVQSSGALRLAPGLNEEASLERDSDASATVLHTVRLEALDDLELGPVSFVKIDVEGHEMALIDGARRTLARWHPAVLIEVEDRHAPGSVARVRRAMEDLGYSGFFLDDVKLRPIAEFDAARDQNPAVVVNSIKTGRYVNNFIYLERRQASERVAAVEAWLAMAPTARRRARRQLDARGLEPAWHGLFAWRGAAT